MLECEESEEPRVKYFDILRELHKDCLQKAQLLLKILGIEAEITTQINEARQERLECGLFVCHYFEDELRDWLKGKGQVGWPSETRLNKIRQYLMNISTSLESFRQNWAAQVIEDEKKAEEEDKAAAIKAVSILRKNA